MSLRIGTLSCDLIDLATEAPGQFLYVTQLCMTQVLGAGALVRVATASGLTLSAAATPLDTTCQVVGILSSK
jgi:hypothetical protein